MENTTITLKRSIVTLVVIAVLAGLANKQIVAAINSRGGRAVGISGADGALVEGRMKNQEMGYVGEVVRVMDEAGISRKVARLVPVGVVKG